MSRIPIKALEEDLFEAENPLDILIFATSHENKLPYTCCAERRRCEGVSSGSYFTSVHNTLSCD